MSYFLAVDGGSTRTHVLCATETGQVVGEGVSGPTSLAVSNPGAASFNLREGVRQATSGLTPGFVVSKLVLGLAGMDTDSEARVAQEVFSQVLHDYQIEKWQLVNDIVITLENGTSAPNALALLAGTGSNCYGRNQAGETAQVGGLDYLLSDQGSGYAIGRAVLRQVVKSFDGRGPKTELEQFVCEHFKIATIAELKSKVHNPPLTKTEIAELTQVCLRAFDQGDEIAKDIFDHNAEELFVMAKTVMTKLHLTDQATECVLAGSVTKIAYMQSKLSEGLQQLCPQLTLVVPSHPPVHGALKLALK